MPTDPEPAPDEPPRDPGGGSEPTRPIPKVGREDPTRPIAGSDPASGADPGPGWRRFGGRDMPIAIATGLLLAGLLLGTLFWHPAAFTALVLVLVVLGIFETGRVFRRQGAPFDEPVVLVAAVTMIVGAHRAGPTGQAVGVAVLLLGAFLSSFTRHRRGDVVRSVATTIFVGLWLPFLASYAALLVTREFDAWVAVLAAIVVPVVSDIGAFVTGTRFGRTKLAPSLSPKKSWEGLAGGFAVAILVAVVIFPVLGQVGVFDPLTAVVFALAVGVAGVAGDLAESMVKRDLGVKDLGGVIAGHGGVLDRADSILFALPVAYYVLLALGR